MGTPSVQAGTLNLSGHRKNFYDWEYAQKVWGQLNTWEAEKEEWAKYSADFEPWLEIWKKNRDQAKKVLATYPEQKRHNIQRAFDIQLAWDTWYDSHYWPWFNRYRTVVQVASAKGLMEVISFDESRVNFNARRKARGRLDCIPQKAIDECGLLPDWRSPDMKAEEKKLELRRGELMNSRNIKAEMKKFKDMREELD